MHYTNSICLPDTLLCSSQLPNIGVGDIVVLGEAGGNTHSLRSTLCSRRAPPVYGYERGDDGNGDGLSFVQLSKGSSFNDVLANWD